ncbi:MAG TPA: type I DNA topoisomerase [Alphaproteobacteria bacterium]|nr:type I DNA topoisomerase [Alphaproteobacteria bacterium]
MDLVIVESPAKAKTINKYLGSEYKVLASFGHVRDLVEKDGAVEPDRDFDMHWEVGDRAKRPLGEITKALKGAKRLYLATDPDREGEAISWHLREVLAEAKRLGKIDVKRVVFNEITKTAILEAMKHPRDIDSDLVEAYLARRALDFLVGFTLSPVLWRRMPGSRSAGRVQSVALLIICERETEIESFKPQEYWTVDVDLRTPAGQTFTAKLTHLDGKKLEKFDLGTEDAAKRAVAAINAGDPFTVTSIEKKRTRRNPLPPFTTSTLQQEASRKLGFGASRTMRLAQQLYEGADIGGETVGLITYMRTDSVTLSQEAIAAARQLIGKQFGPNFVPESPRAWKTQAKNAQEAHEAIRPTDLTRRPEDVADYLDNDQRRLYELIWRRTIASEMESAQLDQTAVDVSSADRKVVLRATGSIIVFEGFLAVYREDTDDPGDAEDDSKILPAMAEGDATARDAVKPEQHFTQPPPRYSEASLVKRLEELGIGRPSTYASIIEVLQDRGYVRLDKRRFIPEDRGRLVVAFLEAFFHRYVEYDFTAKLEDQLDDISGGRANWKAVLREFWKSFSKTPEGARLLPPVKEAVKILIDGLGSIREVIDVVNERLRPHFFPETGDGKDPRQCPVCSEGQLGIKFSRTSGAFIGCSRYPECKYTRSLSVANGDEAGAAMQGTRTLGVDPATGEMVSLRKGPFGLYLQLGEGAEGIKPKRVSLPRDIAPDAITLDVALKLLALPREVGLHPETGEMIYAGLGRFGPYLKHAGKYKSLENTQDLLTVGNNRAVEILAQPNRGRRNAAPATPQKEIGPHPDDSKMITAGVGRYGPYVKHGKTYANLPKGRGIEDVTLEEAIEWINARNEKMGAGGGSKRRAASKAKGGKKKAPAPAPADGD